MPIKKSSEIGRETDSRFTKSKSTQKLTNIAERFDDSTDNDNPFDDALQYVNKKIDECIDVVNANDTKTGTTLNERSRIAANHAKVGITTSQASAITANTAKVGTEVDLTGNASSGIILKATIGNNKGAYSIKFTMTDSSGRETVQKTATINLS